MSAGKELDEEQLRSMLGKRTKSLIERIERNIKIGFVVLLGLILLFSIDDFWLSPQTIETFYEEMPIPSWVIFLAVFGNVLVFSTFIYFVVSYYRAKNKCDVVSDLKETLKKIINTLVLILLAMGSAFVSGMFIGTEHNAAMQGIQISDIETGKLVLIVGITIGVLALFGGTIFLLLRWGFRRLYGNYIYKLKATLKELMEIED